MIDPKVRAININTESEVRRALEQRNAVGKEIAIHRAILVRIGHNVVESLLENKNYVPSASKDR